jgi:hypothetical protein
MDDPMDERNQMNGFEDQLTQAFVRRPAPPGLKRRILNQRAQRHTVQMRNRVVTALRITNRTLDQIQARLAARESAE